MSEDFDVLAIGEAIMNWIPTEPADSLAHAQTFHRAGGGAPGILAANIVRLGGRAALIARMGADSFGDFLRTQWQLAGVSVEYLVRDPFAPTSAVFTAGRKGALDQVVLRSADVLLEPGDIPDEAIERARLVHTTTFALAREPERSAVISALKRASQKGKITSLDPNYDVDLWPNRAEARAVLRAVYQYVTVTKPSYADAVRLFGTEQTNKEPEDYIRMYHGLGADMVVMTLGEMGALISDGEDIMHLAVHPITVTDATGAGDAYWSGFLMAMLDGHLPPYCALVGRAVAERKLQTAGPLTEPIDLQAIYSDADADTDLGWWGAIQV